MCAKIDNMLIWVSTATKIFLLVCNCHSGKAKTVCLFPDVTQYYTFKD